MKLPLIKQNHNAGIHIYPLNLRLMLICWKIHIGFCNPNIHRRTLIGVQSNMIRYGIGSWSGDICWRGTGGWLAYDVGIPPIRSSVPLGANTIPSPPPGKVRGVPTKLKDEIAASHLTTPVCIPLCAVQKALKRPFHEGLYFRPPDENVSRA